MNWSIKKWVFGPRRWTEHNVDSVANKGCSTVNYRQFPAFDHSYLSYSDHGGRWVFQDIFYYYFLEILLSNLELVLLELKHFYKTYRTSLFSFYLLILYSMVHNHSVIRSTFCTFPIKREN